MGDSQTSIAYHGTQIANATVGRHPKKALVAMAAITVGIIYFAVKAQKYKTKYQACANPKAGYLSRINNLNTGGMNPMWQHGGDGAMQANSNTSYVPDSVPTSYQGAIHSHLRPDHRRHAILKAARLGGRRATREGMYPSPAGGCKPGDAAWVASDGSNVCLSPDELKAAQAGSQNIGQLIDDSDEALLTTDCGSTWDPAAVADTQALVSLGAISGRADAEGHLRDIIDGDPSAQLGDKQLTALLYAGAP